VKRNISFFVLAGIVLCGVYVAQGNPHVDIQVILLPKAGGGYTYEAINNSNGGLLTAPDGTVVPRSKYMTFDSFADLGARLFGNWTASNFAVYPNTSFVFDVEPFTFADVGLETPVIVSPAPGSTVPEHLVVKWDFPTGKSGSASNALPASSGLELDTLVPGADGPNSVGLGYRLVAPGPSFLFVRVIATSNLPNPPIIFHSPGLDGLNLTASLSFSAVSATAEYQVVVPEPTSAALIAFAAMMLGCRYRRA
jgi:hypothetical protein